MWTQRAPSFVSLSYARVTFHIFNYHLHRRTIAIVVFVFSFRWKIGAAMIRVPCCTMITISLKEEGEVYTPYKSAY